ncbi:Smad nuclear-interacting protein 1 [Rhizophlyctis rosea]|uniref:Smad nuclear-interacting protein 1 n=1 Tax=Rhizophlyctis rosea TaxID=64517 RepID=A0AAD5X2I1_9FUNG|nr:Smad nuclear-interacting protein 1 [Rhizophlyctis rosea]
MPHTRSPSPRSSRRDDRDRDSRSHGRRRSRSPSPRPRSPLPPRRRDDRDDRRGPKSRSRSPGRRPDDPGTKQQHQNRISQNHIAMESPSASAPKEPQAPKELPNYSQSGALAAEQNTYKGVVLKYSEPPEARKPSKKYRLYVYKGSEEIDVLHIHRQSAFLVGRERLVADLPIDHPSCSKQHAVLQYRQVVETTPTGEVIRTTKPYIIDLDSTNGTYINQERIPPSRYYELKLTDMIKFGFSSREYMLMAEDMVVEEKKSRED